MKTDTLYSYLYIFIFSFIYGVLNEFLAYSEIIYDHNKWGGIFEIPILIFTYLLNGVIAYVLFVRKVKIACFFYSDLLLISLNVFIKGCDTIYLVGGWAMLRYGFLGSLLFVIMGWMQRYNILTCKGDILLFWLIFGVVSTLLILFIILIVHHITSFVLEHIKKS